jgi:capsular exopolysaccharide synthesis family protein
VDEALVAFHDRGAPITEAYRSLRTRLLTANPNKDHQVIAVTSATPKEGKSVSALNLCAVLAEVRHLKILAVDADLRYSSLATMLGLPPAPGLASVLNGATKYNDVVQRTPLPNFDLLPAGETAECAASALLTSSLLPALLNQARKDYDYTIVDTPAAAQGTDVGMIGQLCNGAIMVVRLHRTQEAAAKRAVRLLQVNNVPILGCVLIGRDSTTAQPGGYSAAGYAGSRQKRQRPSRKRPSRAGTEGSTL